MNIAFNNFVTNSFINELKHVGISEILIEDFLDRNFNNNGIIYIASYVESISIWEDVLRKQMYSMTEVLLLCNVCKWKEEKNNIFFVF